MPVIAQCDRCRRQEVLDSFVEDIGPMFLAFSAWDQVWWLAERGSTNGKKRPKTKVFCPRCQQLYNVARRFAQDGGSD